MPSTPQISRASKIKGGLLTVFVTVFKIMEDYLGHRKIRMITESTDIDSNDIIAGNISDGANDFVPKTEQETEINKKHS